MFKLINLIKNKKMNPDKPKQTCLECGKECEEEFCNLKCSNLWVYNFHRIKRRNKNEM